MTSFGGEDKQLVYDVIEKWELEDWSKKQVDIKETTLLFSCFAWTDVNKMVFSFHIQNYKG